MLTLYVVWWLVNQLEMDLLSAVLDQFVSVGVIIIIVIFQQEVRRFLLFLGNTTWGQRVNFLSRFLDRNLQDDEQKKEHIDILIRALRRMGRKKVGALIVFAKDINLEGIIDSGVALDAQISEPLLESIFNKESPLHDGAVLIGNGKIRAASCILPVSENPNLPKNAGLRHRAAVGITEKLNVAAVVVSEETGKISIAYDGQLQRGLTQTQLQEGLELHLN